MKNSTITTEGIYKEGVLVPRVRPSGRRMAIITFLPPAQKESFGVSDERIWEGLRPLSRQIRKELFREMYPRFYARTQKQKKTA